MEAQQHENIREKAGEKPGEVKLTERNYDLPDTSPASPPSPSSSPSHEFSFTISLHSSSTTGPGSKSKAPPPSSFAVDLSPADDIFFHGHLLPLHLLSHFSVSPRSSTNSLESFTIPVRESLEDQEPTKRSGASNGKNNTFTCSSKSDRQESSNNGRQTKGRAKSKSKCKSFSLFGWRRGCEERGRGSDKVKLKKRLSFDVSHVLKRYARLVRPLLFFRGGRREDVQFQEHPYSFSGNLGSRNKQEYLRGSKGPLSAPASMRTSPKNSGLLVATTTLPSYTSDSTMEELQAAIQAAIAHCKNSIAAEEKIKC